MNTKHLSGFLLFPFALLIFAVSDATAKYMSVYFAVPLLAWVRYITHLAFMLATVAPRMGRDLVATSRPWLMMFRGFTQVASTLFVLMAFRTLPLAETTALVFVTPVLVALLAGPMLGEKIRLRSWLATVAGFCGVLLIARPGGYMDGAGVAYALASGYFQFFPRPDAAYTLQMRYYAQGESIAQANVEVSWLLHAADLVVAEVGLVIAERHLQNAALAASFRDAAAQALKTLQDRHVAMQEVNRNRLVGGE